MDMTTFHPLSLIPKDLKSYTRANENLPPSDGLGLWNLLHVPHTECYDCTRVLVIVDLY